MYVVAGPSGSGKTSAFPGDQFGCDYFNADAYAATLNGGSYVGIPKTLRKEVGPICEAFIQDHIAAHKSFTTETTLRSSIVFDQIRHAHQAGFRVQFIYVCVGDIDTSIDRVAGRAYLGGHSGSENTVREIRSRSLANFPRALDELGRTIDILDIFDNSILDSRPKLIASFQARKITSLAQRIPPWLTEALETTAYPTQSLRAHFRKNQPLPAPLGS
jgi:predicted ABC-type ATPase